MMGYAGDQGGATLIEQLVSLGLGALMMTGLFGYFRAELFQLRSLETKAATMEDARGAIDIMVRDLKNAGSWGTGTAPVETGALDDPSGDGDNVCNRVYAATPTLLHVQMDLNGDGDCVDVEPRENIRYELGGPTAVCPGSTVIRRNGDCLIAYVTTPRLFIYYDHSGNDLGSAPARGAIRRVRIGFTVQVRNPDPRVAGHVASTLSSSVEFRN
jgi:hypothetical protein